MTSKLVGQAFEPDIRLESLTYEVIAGRRLGFCRPESIGLAEISRRQMSRFTLGMKNVIPPEGNLVEVVFPPFVFSASNRRERFGLTTRMLRFIALHAAAPMLLRRFRAGRIREMKTIRIFGVRARRLASADGRF